MPITSGFSKQQANNTLALIDSIKKRTKTICQAEPSIPYPSDLSAEQKSTWDLLSKSFSNEPLTEREKQELWTNKAAELTELLEKYASHFTKKKLIFKKNDVLSLTIILNHNGIFKETKCYFLVRNDELELSEDILFSRFKSYFWDNILANLFNNNVIFHALQIRRVFPLYRVTPVITMPFVLPGNLDTVKYPTTSEIFKIQMASNFVSSNKGANSIKIPFVIEALKTPNSELPTPIANSIKKLKTFCTTNLQIQNDGDRPSATFSEIRLVMPIKRRDLPLPFVLVDNVLLLGLVKANKKELDLENPQDLP
jgi:hypothetical protein